VVLATQKITKNNNKKQTNKLPETKQKERKKCQIISNRKQRNKQSY